MSNMVMLQFCEFVDLNDDLNRIEPDDLNPIEPDADYKRFGFRFFDNYEMTYSMVADTKEILKKQIGEVEGESFALKALRIVINHSDRVVESILDGVEMAKSGIHINDTYYEWDEIKEVLTGEDDSMLKCSICGDSVCCSELREHLRQHNPNADNMDSSEVRNMFVH